MYKAFIREIAKGYRLYYENRKFNITVEFEKVDEDFYVFLRKDNLFNTNKPGKISYESQKILHVDEKKYVKNPKNTSLRYLQDILFKDEDISIPGRESISFRIQDKHGLFID